MLKVSHQWEATCRTKLSPMLMITVVEGLRDSGINTGFFPSPDNFECDASQVRMMACLPEAWKKLVGDDNHLELDYVLWPPERTNDKKLGLERKSYREVGMPFKMLDKLSSFRL